MKLKSPKKKGMALEYIWVKKLQEAKLDPHARRSIMSGAVFEAGDIKTKNFIFECKFYQRMAIYELWDQLVRESAGTNKTKALVLKANNRNILVAMDADDWLEMAAYSIMAGYGLR